MPWEEALRRLASRLLAFAQSSPARRKEARARALFWNAEEAPSPARLDAAGHLRFLEWFLHDYVSPRDESPVLGAFADQAPGLSSMEEQLLLTMLLTPVRAFEVVEVREPRGVAVKDLLAGGECVMGPLGLPLHLIHSDIAVCRLLSVGRLKRPGIGLLRLPARGRAEMLAYLRTVYRLSRVGRHISLEDFLDQSPHLYHHFNLLRGEDLGAEAQGTIRVTPFAPGWARLRGADAGRIRAVLERQPALEWLDDGEAGMRYAWVDLQSGVARAELALNVNEILVRADTREDLAQACALLLTSLRGLVEPAGAGDLEASVGGGEESAPARPWGASFLTRMLGRWAETPSPLLRNRAPRELCKSPARRQEVAALLVGLERDLARQKRLGRAWVDTTPLREQLGIPVAPPA